jgi:hypothetical protein
MNKITTHAVTSSPVWEQLETHARGKIQEFVQKLLEEEVEEIARPEEERAPRVGESGRLSQWGREAPAVGGSSGPR